MTTTPLDNSTQQWLEIEVRLFAAAAQLAGARSVTVSVPWGSCVPQLMERLIARLRTEVTD